MDQEIAQAKELFESCQIEESFELYTRILSQIQDLSSVSCEVIDNFAELASLLGDRRTAIHAYKSSISQFPSDSPTKYFNLAQLLSGIDSLNLYKQGIALSSDRPSIAKAYASIAELYMTDLCDEHEAEQECELHVQKSIETDENCIDGFLCLANLRIIRGNRDDARAAMNKVINILDTSGFDNLPTSQMVIEVAKLLTELELFDEVLQVCELGLLMDSSQSDLLYMHTFALAKLDRVGECEEGINTLKGRDLDSELKEAVLELEHYLNNSFQS